MDLKTIPDKIRYWAETQPMKEVFVFIGPHGTRMAMNCKDVFHWSTRCATMLMKNGIKKGDVVCNTLPNCPERLVYDFGIMTIGAVAMTGQTFLADGSDISHALTKSKAKVLVVDPGQQNGPWEVIKTLIDSIDESTMNITSNKLPELQKAVFVKARAHAPDKSSLFDYFPDDPAVGESVVKLDDVAVLWPTSGSTGFSKLVPHTHGEVHRYADSIGQILDFQKGEVIYNDMPLGWSGGNCHRYLSAGLTRVLFDSRCIKPPDFPSFVWNAICREKCTAAMMTPFFVKQILDLQKLGKLKEFMLEKVVMGGQPIKRNSTKMIGRMCKTLYAGYGSTEIGGVSAVKYTHEVNHEEFLVGKPLKMFQIKVVDQNLTACPVGTSGEILIKSETFSAGYMNDPEKTSISFTSDRWFRTNDLGHLDENGRLYVEGRRSDAIMRGVYIVYPSWLETRLRACPEIDDAAVVPVPDPVLYNEICACVIRRLGSRLGEEEIRVKCEKMFVTKSSDDMTAVPKYYLILDEFPTKDNGKLDRKELASIAQNMLGLN